MDNLVLKEADLQDFAKVIENFVCRTGSCHRQFDLLARRFEVDEADVSEWHGSTGIAARCYALVRYVNATPKLIDIAHHIMNEYRNVTQEVNRIFSRYGIRVEEVEGKLVLSPLEPGLLAEKREEIKSWIEKNASPKVKSYLHSALANFAQGNYEDTLEDCRKCLEALTTGKGFSNAVTELVNAKIITEGDNKNRKLDAELLRAVYGYTSTLGAHTSAKQDAPDSEQALYGLFITESTIYFILKRLTSAKTKPIQLTHWA